MSARRPAGRMAALVAAWVLAAAAPAVPARAADGDEPPTYRRVFFPARDAAQLVPSTFRPVPADELEARVDAARAVATHPEGQLERARYIAVADVANRLLDCRESLWEVAYEDDAPGRIRLGRTNVALRPAEEALPDFGSPRLATSSEGELLALVNGDARLSTSWRLRGQADQLGGVRYRLRLPAAIHATMALALPEGWAVEADQGIARVADGPPAGWSPEDADAQLLDADGEPGPLSPVRWWHVELGGVGSVELRVRPEPQPGVDRDIVVRRTLMDYRAEADGIHWTARYLFDVPSDGILPPLGINGIGRVASVTVDGRPSSWAEVRSQETTFLRLQNPAGGLREVAESGTVSVVVSGVAPRPAPGLTELPWVHPVEHRVLAADPTAIFELRIAAGLRLDQLALDAPWRLVEQRQMDDGARRLQFSGPAEMPPPAVSVVDAEAATDAVAATRVTVEEDRLVARWTCRMRPPQDAPHVVWLRVDDAWQVDAVSLPEAGRSQPINRTVRREFVPVWIEADDVVDDYLTLEIVGNRPLPSPAGGEVRLPAVEFVRLRDAWPAEAVVFQVPSNRVAQLGTEATRRRAALDRFPSELQRLLKPLPSSALLLQGAGGLPAIQLRPRDAKFDAQVRVTAERSGESIAEQIHVRCTPRSGLLNDVRVHVQPDTAETIRWSAELAEQQRRVAVTAIRQGGVDSAVWRLQFAQPVSEAVDLVGRMEVDSGESVRLPLVSVPAAADQRAEVWLDAEVSLAETPPGLERLPNAEEGEALPIRYRYAPGANEPVKIALERKRATPPVVWDRRMNARMDASGRVEIAASVWANGEESLRFDFPESLDVHEISRGGSAIPLAGLVRGEDYVEIPGPWGAAPAVIRLEGRAERLGPFGWRWKPPVLRFSGPSVEGRWMLANDEGLWPLAPAAPLRPAGGERRYAVATDQHLMLLRADLGMAIAAALAIAALGVGWWVGRWCGWLPAAVAFCVLAAATLFSGPVATAIGLWGLAWLGGGIVASGERRWQIATVAREAPSGSVGSLTFYLVVAAVGAGGIFAARGWSREIFPDSEAAAVLIPVDGAGKQFGNNVYIPETLYRRLFLEEDSEQATEPAVFRSADYRVAIERAVDSGGESSARLDATWVLEVASTDRDVLLPIDGERVRQITLDEDGADRTVRWQPTESGIRLQPPRRGAVALRLQLDAPVGPTADRKGESIQWRVPIVHRSRLVVDSEAGIEEVEVEGDSAWVEVDGTARRVETMLGAAEEVSVRWRDALARDAARDEEVDGAPDDRPRLWVRLGATSLVEEWEIEPRAERLGQETRIEVAADALPIVTSRSWRLVESVVDDGQAYLTLLATQSDPGPVRLLWERAAVAEEVDSIQLPIPRIDGSRPDGVLVAFDLPDGWETEVNDETASELEAAEFLTRWEGHRGRVGSAMELAAASSLAVALVPPGDPATEATEVHRVNVGANGLRVDYRLDVERLEAGTPPLRVRLPDRFRLDRAEINGSDLTAVPRVDEAGHRWLALHPREIGDALSVAISGRLAYSGAAAEGRVDGPRRFRLPRLTMKGLEPRESRYEVTRDAWTLVSEVRPSPLDREPLKTSSVDQLSRLEIPEWQWTLSESDAALDDSQFLPGLYDVTQRSAAFDATVVTRMRWNEGTWRAESDLRIRPKASDPDFLTVEVPSSWSDNLEVEPKTDWLAGPAGEDATRVIQIIPPPSEADDGYRLRLAGRVTAGPSGRVTAPMIRLPRGTSQQFFILPRRLTAQSIAWSTQGIREVAEPASAGIPPESVPPEHVVYQAVTGFSAAPVLTTLATSAGPSAISPTRDARMFLAERGASHLAVTWDLVPAGRSQIAVRLPSAATVLGVWSAESVASWQQDGDRLVVDLNLSGLASRLELLLRLPEERSGAAGMLPELVDVPVERSWLTVLRPPGSAGAALQIGAEPWASASAFERDSGRAAAIAQSLSLSVDALAERPPSEIEAWIRPWLARLERIRDAQGGTRDAEALEQIDEQIARYVERLGVANLDVSASDSRWNNDRWRTVAIAQAPGEPAAPPIRVEMTPEHASGQFALVALIGCAGVGGLVVRSAARRRETALLASGIFASAIGVGLFLAGLPTEFAALAVLGVVVEAALADLAKRAVFREPIGAAENA